MIILNVPDMTCGHCEKVITTAVLAVDSRAKIHFDQKKKSVAIQSTSGLQKIRNAIEATGYAAIAAEDEEQARDHCCGECSA